MKWFSIILSILLLGVLTVAAPADSRTFNQDEVLSIYAAAGAKLGKQGILLEEIDKTPHRNFKMWWEQHILSYTLRSCVMAFIKVSKSSSTYTGYISYAFYDDDFDGKVDRCYRDYYVIMPDGEVVSFLSEMPEDSLHEVFIDWRVNVPNAQEMYEAELEFWWNELKEIINAN